MNSLKSEREQNLIIRNQFDVAEAVVNKGNKKIKTNIKLDMDAPDALAEYLEGGYDKKKKMHS